MKMKRVNSNDNKTKTWANILVSAPWYFPSWMTNQSESYFDIELNRTSERTRDFSRESAWDLHKHCTLYAASKLGLIDRFKSVNPPIVGKSVNF